MNGDPGTVDAGFRVIRFAQGSLLDVDVEAVVNAVNAVGVMDKGTRVPLRSATQDRLVIPGEWMIRKQVATLTLAAQH